MRKVVAAVGNDTGTSVVDAQRLFEQLTRDGIPGNEWLADHVHPSIRGHQQLAARLLRELVRCHIAQPHEGWQQRRDQLYQQQFASLDALYWIRGQQRLRGLQRWSQGRANLVKPQGTGSVGRALLPVATFDGQECPSYPSVTTLQGTCRRLSNHLLARFPKRSEKHTRQVVRDNQGAASAPRVSAYLFTHCRAETEDRPVAA